MHENDKRSHPRTSDSLPGRLFLKHKKSGDILAGPESCTLKDISAGGAGISVPRIFLDTHHLFYTPHEDPGLVLMLEFSVAEHSDLLLTITVRPVWFDKDENKDFSLGVEFAEPPGDEVLNKLMALCANDSSLSKTWLQRLVDRFRSSK